MHPRLQANRLVTGSRHAMGYTVASAASICIRRGIRQPLRPPCLLRAAPNSTTAALSWHHGSR
eukprot:3843966-Prorocentrum_lima.AAC.1